MRKVFIVGDIASAFEERMRALAKESIAQKRIINHFYNRRIWLNKEDSPSLGNLIAFDGEVKYSEGAERTTFLAISDCRFTIKLTKNTETIDDFIDKMKLLKNEIELFISHLEQAK